jgi:hypothetical protein
VNTSVGGVGGLDALGVVVLGLVVHFLDPHDGSRGGVHGLDQALSVGLLGLLDPHDGTLGEVHGLDQTLFVGLLGLLVPHDGSPVGVHGADQVRSVVSLGGFHSDDDGQPFVFVVVVARVVLEDLDLTDNLDLPDLDLPDFDFTALPLLTKYSTSVDSPSSSADSSQSSSTPHDCGFQRVSSSGAGAVHTRDPHPSPRRRRPFPALPPPSTTDPADHAPVPLHPPDLTHLLFLDDTSTLDDQPPSLSPLSSQPLLSMSASQPSVPSHPCINILLPSELPLMAPAVADDDGVPSPRPIPANLTRPIIDEASTAAIATARSLTTLGSRSRLGSSMLVCLYSFFSLMDVCLEDEGMGMEWGSLVRWFVGSWVRGFLGSFVRRRR